MSARTASTGALPGARLNPRRLPELHKRLSSLPLLWRVFGTNAVALTFAAVALAFAPVTVSVPIALSELAILLGGLAVLLALNLVMLRSAA